MAEKQKLILCSICEKWKENDFFFRETRCDDCFEKMLDDEEEEFKIYDEQNAKCFVCGNKLTVWITATIDGVRRAIHIECEKQNSRTGSQLNPHGRA